MARNRDARQRQLHDVQRARGGAAGGQTRPGQNPFDAVLQEEGEEEGEEDEAVGGRALAGGTVRAPVHVAEGEWHEPMEPAKEFPCSMPSPCLM